MGSHRVGHDWDDLAVAVFRENVDFFKKLILYSAALLNSLICYNSFRVEIVGFSVYSIMSSTTGEFFLFPSNLDAFYFFFLPDCYD